MSQIARAGRAFVRSSPSAARPFSSSTLAAKQATSSTSTDAEGKPRRVLTFAKKSGLSNFKTYLPVTPSLRQLRVPISEHLHKGGPFRPLTEAKRSQGGRNDHGRITIRARGGGHKRRIRLVDFTRRETGEQEVLRIEYDPGRSAHIALLKHKASGAMSYILAPTGLRAGDTVQSFRSGVPDAFLLGGGAPAAPVEDALEGFVDPAAPQSVLPPAGQQAPPSLAQIDVSVLRSLALRPGNCLPIRLIPVGTVVHGISLSPVGKAVLERSAGGSARIISASSPGGKHAQIRLSSGEVRLVGLDCVASIGTVSNPDHQHRNLGKAGRMRWLGFRPQSRGVAMNATDHPHGGGRGKSKGGTHPTDEWGNGMKGQRTRAPGSKNGNKAVVRERPRAGMKNKKR
ncbi:mitochondrial 54S ribosomal protein rml2 [Rhodotorula kratochvilovae]